MLLRGVSNVDICARKSVPSSVVHVGILDLSEEMAVLQKCQRGWKLLLSSGRFGEFLGCLWGVLVSQGYCHHGGAAKCQECPFLKTIQ